MSLDITEAQGELKKVLGRDKAPTRGEMTSYLLGFARGLLTQVEHGAAVGQAPEEAPINYIKCQHCGKETPRDAASCIHCHRKPR